MKSMTKFSADLLSSATPVFVSLSKVMTIFQNNCVMVLESYPMDFASAYTFEQNYRKNMTTNTLLKSAC